MIWRSFGQAIPMKPVSKKRTGIPLDRADSMANERTEVV
jgi:hypothetical protein